MTTVRLPLRRGLATGAAVMLFAAGSVLMTATPAWAATITVDDDDLAADYPTIGEAVAAANPGDVIQVAAGTYNESVTVPAALTLTGAGAATTAINGKLTLNAPTTINGFTITDASNPVTIGAGGAGSELFGNVLDGAGTATHGIYISGSDATSAMPTSIHDNQITDAGYGNGGAVWVFDSDWVNIIDNTFTDSVGDAVGVNIGRGSSDLVITGNSFDGFGNAIVLIANAPAPFTGSSDILIADNTITNTSSSAVYVGGNNIADVTIDGNTFSGVAASAIEFAAGYSGDPDAWIVPGAGDLDGISITGNDIQSADYGISVGDGVLIEAEGSILSEGNIFGTMGSGVAIRSLATTEPAVVSDGDDLGSATVSGAVTIVSAAAPAAPTLPNTGAESTPLLIAGGALLLSGGVLMAVRRRVRPRRRNA